MKTLTELLGRQDKDFFLQNHFTRQPYSAPLNAKKFNHLLNWNVVEQVLNEKNQFLES
jgi:hypothetical protein